MIVGCADIFIADRFTNLSIGVLREHNPASPDRANELVLVLLPDDFVHQTICFLGSEVICQHCLNVLFHLVFVLTHSRRHQLSAAFTDLLGILRWCLDHDICEPRGDIVRGPIYSLLVAYLQEARALGNVG